MRRIERAVGFVIGLGAIAALVATLFGWQPSLHTVTWVAFAALAASMVPNFRKSP